MNKFTVLIISLLLTGCAWLKPSPETESEREAVNPTVPQAYLDLQWKLDAEFCNEHFSDTMTPEECMSDLGWKML